MTNEPTIEQTARAAARSIRETAAEAARLIGHLGKRLDALSLDLARDVGEVTRDARAFATAATEQATAARDKATNLYRATPRAAKLAQAATTILARQRWLRLAAAAAGHDQLRPDDHRDLAHRTTQIAAHLRGGIAKLGQLASCRPDLVGPIWASELASLQDDVPPIAADAIRARIEAELGRPLLDSYDVSVDGAPRTPGLFASFDDDPLAAASLAQVHAATLHDGTRVVVKVQVPGIEDVIAADVAALRAVASMLGDIPGLDLATLSDELSRALLLELDYVAEANALRAFAGGSVVVPRPIADASSARVITMTRIDGTRLTEWLEHAAPEARDRLLGDLVSEIAAQILVRGRVHADPHPGNFLVTHAGALAMLDFGCTLELSPPERAAYARLVFAIAGNNHGAAAAELATLGFVSDAPEVLVAVTESLIGALRPGAAVSELDWESAFAAQIAHAKQLTGLVVPRSFVLLGRVLATLAGLLATYRPRIQVHALILSHLAAALG